MRSTLAIGCLFSLASSSAFAVELARGHKVLNQAPNCADLGLIHAVTDASNVQGIVEKTNFALNQNALPPSTAIAVGGRLLQAAGLPKLRNGNPSYERAIIVLRATANMTAGKVFVTSRVEEGRTGEFRVHFDDIFWSETWGKKQPKYNLSATVCSYDVGSDGLRVDAKGIKGAQVVSGGGDTDLVYRFDTSGEKSVFAMVVWSSLVDESVAPTMPRAAIEATTGPRVTLTFSKDPPPAPREPFNGAIATWNSSVVLSREGWTKLDQLAALLKPHGVPVHATSGDRTASQQAKALLGLPSLSAYDDAVEKAFADVPRDHASYLAVVERLQKKGAFNSDHMGGHNVDLRTNGLSDAQKEKLLWAAKQIYLKHVGRITNHLHLEW